MNNKKIIKTSLVAITLFFAATSNINATTIKYYGSKAGLFRACKGDLVAVCKEVITDKIISKEEMEPLSLDENVDEVKSDTPTEYVTVRYDGIDYIIPLSSINLEDGSIDENQL